MQRAVSFNRLKLNGYVGELRDLKNLFKYRLLGRCCASQ